MYANYMLESGYTMHVMAGRTCHSPCVTRRILPVQIGGGQEGPKVKPTLLLLRQIYVQGLKDASYNFAKFSVSYNFASQAELFLQLQGGFRASEVNLGGLQGFGSGTARRFMGTYHHSCFVG